MKVRFFISLTLLVSLSNLWAAAKPPATTTPPAKPVTGGGGGAPAAPTVYPTFPNKVVNGNPPSGEPESPALIVPYVPAVEIQHPVIHNDILVKAPLNPFPGSLSRPPLFITQAESVHRTTSFSEPVTVNRDIPISAVSLSNDTDLRETVIDATVAEHEYENDLAMIDINTRFHAQQIALYKKHVTPKQTFRESEARLIKSRFKADESKGRWMAYNAEVDLLRLKILQASKVQVPLLDVAEGYAKLWENRLARVKGSEGIAQADYDYLKEVLQMNQALKQATATSEAALIEAERDAEQAQVVLKLAHKVVAETAQYYQESLESVEKVKNHRAEEPN